MARKTENVGGPDGCRIAADARCGQRGYRVILRQQRASAHRSRGRRHHAQNAPNAVWQPCRGVWMIMRREPLVLPRCNQVEQIFVQQLGSSSAMSLNRRTSIAAGLLCGRSM